jgi:exonuclease III
VAILISDKMIIHQIKVTKDIVILNNDKKINPPGDINLSVYALNNRISQYMKQKVIELKVEIAKSRIIVGDFNTPITMADRTTTQKSRRLYTNSVIPNQQNLMDIYRTLLPTTAGYTFFSSVHRIYMKSLYLHKSIIS